VKDFTATWTMQLKSVVTGNKTVDHFGLSSVQYKDKNIKMGDVLLKYE